MFQHLAVKLLLNLSKKWRREEAEMLYEKTAILEKEYHSSKCTTLWKRCGNVETSHNLYTTL